jgi:ubiquinone/menaquinone biosynthesis C-methylase UbiE
MSFFSFDKISFLYDFIEKNIVKDFKGSLDIISKYLFLKKDFILIDIGGGTGYITSNLSNKVKQAIVLDPSYKMLSKMNNSCISLIQGTGQNIPFKQNTFDIVLMINLLHHLTPDEQEIVLEDAFRVIKKDGILFVIDATHPKKIFAIIFRNIERIIVGQIFHINPNELKNRLKRIGFSNIELYFPKESDWKYAIKAIK